MFIVCVFTASLKEYADQVINIIDNKKVIQERYYRNVFSYKLEL